MADKKDFPEAKDAKDTFNAVDTPGFHILQGGKHIGTYETKEDAQLFIDGHLTPQKLEAKIVEGKAAPEVVEDEE